MELQPTVSDHTYKVQYINDGIVQYINDVIHSLEIHINTYVEKVDFHAINLHTTDVIVGYP